MGLWNIMKITDCNRYTMVFLVACATCSAIAATSVNYEIPLFKNSIVLALQKNKNRIWN